MIDSNEMLTTLRDVVSRFDDLKVSYMVTGSFAMSTYATARTTLDIDFVIEVENIDANRIEAKFSPDYYVNADSIRRAEREGSMFNMLSNLSGVKIDCIMKKNDKFETAKFSRRRRATLGDVQFWVITKEDLILSKLRWARDSHSELQFRDIRSLIESGVDEVSILDQIEKEGLQVAWAAFEQWKIRIEK